MRRGREAPLRGLLHVDPLVMQVHGQRMAVAFGAFERAAARDDETHAGRPLEALARGGDHGIERDLTGVELERAEGAHRIDDQAPPLPRHGLGHGAERIEDAGAGLAVDQRHVRDRGIRRQRALDVRGVHRGVLGVVDGRHARDPARGRCARCAGSRRRSAAPARGRRAAPGCRSPPRPKTCRCPASARTRGCRTRARCPAAAHGCGR